MDQYINKKSSSRLVLLSLLSIVILSCSKSEVILNKSDLLEDQTKSIESLKKIVGDEGDFFIITGKLDGVLNSDKSSPELMKKNIPRLSLSDFAKVYKLLQSGSLYKSGTLINFKSLDTIKRKSSSVVIGDEWADDDGPGPAGTYRYLFNYLNSNNPSLFSALNLAFNTNSDGSINGAPSLYFSGIQLFGWQPQQTSLIAFNSSTYTSTFSVTGVVVFGIQLGGGTTLGWTSRLTLYVTINMSEDAKNPVVISAQN